jgi:hypothetical protein
MYSCTLFFNFDTRWGGCSTSCPGRFTRGNDPVSTVQSAGRAPRQVWTDAENLGPRTVQPVASRYTNYAIPAHEKRSHRFINFILYCFKPHSPFALPSKDIQSTSVITDPKGRANTIRCIRGSVKFVFNITFKLIPPKLHLFSVLLRTDMNSHVLHTQKHTLLHP